MEVAENIVGMKNMDLLLEMCGEGKQLLWVKGTYDSLSFRSTPAQNYVRKVLTECKELFDKYEI